MYSETQKAGIKHFFIAIADAIGLWAVTLIVKFFSQAVPIVGQIVTIAAFCVLVYFVYAHYAPVFEYTADSKKIRVVRRTGHREKIVEVKVSDIVSVTSRPAEGVKTDRLCPAIILPKNPLYINYGTRAVLIDGSDKLYECLKNIMNGDKRWQK